MESNNSKDRKQKGISLSHSYCKLVLEFQIAFSSKYTLFSITKLLAPCSVDTSILLGLETDRGITKIELFLLYHSKPPIRTNFQSASSLPGCTDIYSLACSKSNSFPPPLLNSAHVCSWIDLSYFG